MLLDETQHRAQRGKRASKSNSRSQTSAKPPSPRFRVISLDESSDSSIELVGRAQVDGRLDRGNDTVDENDVTLDSSEEDNMAIPPSSATYRSSPTSSPIPLESQETIKPRTSVNWQDIKGTMGPRPRQYTSRMLEPGESDEGEMPSNPEMSGHPCGSTGSQSGIMRLKDWAERSQGKEKVRRRQDQAAQVRTFGQWSPFVSF